MRSILIPIIFMAGDPCVFSKLDQFRGYCFTPFKPVRTAGLITATPGDNCQHGWHIAGNGIQRTFFSSQSGDTVEQRLGIGMMGSVKYGFDGTEFNNVSRIHDGYFIAYLGNDTQVVGNEEQTDAPVHGHL